MTFSGLTTTLSNSAKSINKLAHNISTNLNTTFGPTVSKLHDSIDVLKAGGDVVSAVVKDVTGEDVTIRSIQKGAADFDEKWDAFAKEVNDKFGNASQANQTNIMETFAKSHFGNEVYNVGSAIKNELPGVLDGIADYKETIDKLKTNSKTAEETATKIKKGVDTIVKATEKVAGSLNNAITICTGNGYPVLDTLSRIGGTPSIANLNKVLNLGVAGATTATAANQLKESIKNKDLRGVTDAMAKGATSVNDLLTQLQSISPKFPNVQIPVQITNSIQRLKDGQVVYDAAGNMLTTLVADASGQVTISSLATLTSNFNKNWDTFSSKIDALFQVTPGNGQQAVLETVAKTMLSQNVYNAGSAIKRQLPGVLSGVAGVQDAFKQFGGSYCNPIEAATKIRNGVEKMVQSIEQISQSLNEMAKTWHGNGQGYPLLDALGNLSGTNGIKILDTVLRVGGGAAAVAGNVGALTQAIKNKDIKGTIDAAKKAFDDIKNLTKKGKYDSKTLTANSPTSTTSSGSQNNASSNNQQQSQQSNQGSAAQSDSYVCSGATMRCSMGTSQAKLTVLPIRTVYLTGQPMANISDHLTMVNLAPFGLCRSMGFPATASATAAAMGTLTPMPCMHNTPFPWMSGKNDYLVQGQPALLKNSSKCQCLWGGTISIVDDGQHGEGTQWKSKSKQDHFDTEQTNTDRIDVNAVLDGIQLALDAAGFIPGLGAIPDLTNAAISALRGNWAEAGLSVLAAVPGIGDAAAATKLARKGLKVAKATNKGEKIVKTLSKEEKRTIAKKFISKDVSKEALLHEKGVTPENIEEVFRQVKIERKREAISFYKENMKAEKECKTLITKYSDEAFKNAKKEMKTQKEIETTTQKIKENRKAIVNEINGIDFNKPVERVNIKDGDVFYQYSHGDLLDNNVNIGSFATNDAKFTPSQLGISAVGKNGIKNQYELTVKNVGGNGLPALKSTSKEFEDTWSLKIFRPSDINGNPSISVPVQTTGGGTQFKIPGMNKSIVDIRQINIIR